MRCQHLLLFFFSSLGSYYQRPLLFGPSEAHNMLSLGLTWICFKSMFTKTPSFYEFFHLARDRTSHRIEIASTRGRRRQQLESSRSRGMALGAPAHDYGKASYWDNRYQQDPAPFDWYQKYNALAPLLDLYLHRRHRVLLVGCGNSLLGEDMVNNGYREVFNIDISPVVIEAMQNKHKDHPKLKYVEMDVRDMNSFESGFFDAVIDKGTLDSLMCGPAAQENATKMLEEVGRILKDKGVYILITYGDPSYRLYLLRDPRLWTVKLHVIDREEEPPEKRIREITNPIPQNEDGNFSTAVLGPNPYVHYIYVCIKDESM